MDVDCDKTAKTNYFETKSGGLWAPMPYLPRPPKFLGSRLAYFPHVTAHECVESLWSLGIIW